MFEFIKKKNVRSLIPVVLIFLLAAFLRLLWLDRVPGAITGDELNYILPAKSVAISGEDLSYHWNTFDALFFSYPTALPQAELPYFLLFPTAVFLPLSLFNTRIVYVLISALIVIVMYFFVGKLFGKRAGLIAAFITAINPWQIFIGRTSYEIVSAPFFFILAIYFLIFEKGWRLMFALPLFLLAFYSYIGTKVAFLPIVFAASIFSYYQNKKKFGKQYLIINFACILLVLFFTISILGGTNRTGEIATPFDPAIAGQVDEIRKISFAPSFLTNIFINKFTVYSKILITKVVNSFSVDYLLISGDNFTALYGHGLLYFIDGLFLILGAGFMLIRKGKAFIFIGVLILISTLPHVLHTLETDVFTPHLTLFLTLLLIPIAVGISETLAFLKNKLAIVGLIGIYFLFLFNFLFVYFFQFPLYGHFDFPARLVAKYAVLSSKDNQKVDLYISNTHDFYKKYIYYTNTFNSDNFDEVKRSTNIHKYTLRNINFIPCGDIIEKFDPKAVSVYHSVLCGDYSAGTASAKISRLDDGGEIFRIYNDKVCSGIKLNAYPMGLKMSDFSVENLTAQRFCEVFITR